MNKFCNSNKENVDQVYAFSSYSIDDLSELETYFLNLMRRWFLGGRSQAKINRDLTINHGYFRGHLISQSINNLFTMINLYSPFLLIHCYGHRLLSDDEKIILRLVFPGSFSKADRAINILKIVSEEEFRTLNQLAKEIHFCLR